MTCLYNFSAFGSDRSTKGALVSKPRPAHSTETQNSKIKGVPLLLPTHAMGTGVGVGSNGSDIGNRGNDRKNKMVSLATYLRECQPQQQQQQDVGQSVQASFGAELGNGQKPAAGKLCVTKGTATATVQSQSAPELRCVDLGMVTCAGSRPPAYSSSSCTTTTQSSSSYRGGFTPALAPFPVKGASNTISDGGKTACSPAAHFPGNPPPSTHTPAIKNMNSLCCESTG